MNPSLSRAHRDAHARPSRLEIRLMNLAAAHIRDMVRFGIPRDRAERIFLEELRWQLFPTGDRPAGGVIGEEVIEEMKQQAPF